MAELMNRWTLKKGRTRSVVATDATFLSLEHAFDRRFIGHKINGIDTSNMISVVRTRIAN